MKKVNCIRIFFILTVLFLIGCYQIINLGYTEEEPEIITTEQEIAEEPESETTEYEVVPVSQTIDYKFIIVEESDYLTVYFADKVTLYEYTDIRYSDLPDALRQKIRKGYCIKDEEALFGFLENYSS